MQDFPYLGFGLGLRSPHYQTIVDEKPNVDWFEIIAENYLVEGGKPLYWLDKIRADYPIVIHGVSLSIGGSDPLDHTYLQRLKQLASRIEPAWLSDHLCWTGLNGINAHDLLPLPYTEKTITHLVERIQRVQAYLGRQILLENVSSYITYQQSVLPEWEFYCEVCERADCFMLLDLNNVYVSAINHHFDPFEYLQALPTERIKQYHLAGHSYAEPYLIDTHDTAIVEPVWALYRYALQRFGQVSTMIERDDHIPPLTELLTELDYARQLANNPS
ncbi:MAG: MNIO family bufferin maturase [bacterium]